MNKSIKILLILVITLLSGAAGFFITSLVISTTKGKPDTPVIQEPSGIVSVNVPAQKEASEIPVKELPEPAAVVDTPKEPTIISVSKPVYDPSTKLYSFEVEADGDNLTYVLADVKGNKISSQKTGSFKVQPCKQGQYRVYVTDENGKRSSKQLIDGFVIVYEKLTKDEIQTAFNSGDYMQGDKLDFGHRISRNCVYKFNGLKEDEDKPTSYSEIFNRIGLSTWKSVTVEEIAYDQASNQVKRMTLTVNY